MDEQRPSDEERPVRHLVDGTDLPEGLAATPEKSPDGLHYVYRDGEFLVHMDDMPLVEAKLTANGWPRVSAGARTQRDDDIERIGITRCLTNPGEYVPNVVHELRKPIELTSPSGESREVVPRVYPDIAIPLAWHGGWHPARPRRPAPRLGDLPRRRLLPLPGAGVTVGVLDTGMPEAPMGWFQGRCEHRAADEDPLGNPLTPTDAHGRFIAGVVLRFAPGAKVKCRRLADISDEWVADTELGPAIAALANEGVDIINVSASGSTHENTGMVTTQTVIDKLRETHPHLIVVAAAGNAGVDTPHYPGSLSNVISVGAVNQADNSRPEFSNFGEWVNASAPGADVHSIFVDGTNDDGEQFKGFATWTGTSFAAPTVAAAIATRLSPGGLAHFLRFLPFRRPRTAHEAAFHLIGDSRLPWVRGSGRIVRPRAYAG